MVANRIRELRKARKVTQKQLAIDLQVTRQTIVAIENKRYHPSLALALKIAHYFNLPVEHIFYLTKEEDS